MPLNRFFHTQYIGSLCIHILWDSMSMYVINDVVLCLLATLQMHIYKFNIFPIIFLHFKREPYNEYRNNALNFHNQQQNDKKRKELCVLFILCIVQLVLLQFLI